jgi:hypothetical protein
MLSGLCRHKTKTNTNRARLTFDGQMDTVMYSCVNPPRTYAAQTRLPPRGLCGSLKYVRRKIYVKSQATGPKLTPSAEASRSVLGSTRLPSPHGCEGSLLRCRSQRCKRRRPTCALAVELVQPSAQAWRAAGWLEIPGVRDSCALVVALIGAMVLVKGFNYLAANDYLDRVCYSTSSSFLPIRADMSYVTI